MAFTACRQLQLPLEVIERIENLLLQEHQQTFIKRYGRTMPCTEMTRDKGNAVPSIDNMTQTPGYRLYGFFLQQRHHRRLEQGMQFLLMTKLSLGAYTIQQKTETGLVVKGGEYPTDTHMPFEHLRDVIIFVSSPGEYMLLVGKDRYTGDLSDLRELAKGEEMSELEMDIRTAHFERAQEVRCPVFEGHPEWIYSDSD